MKSTVKNSQSTSARAWCTGKTQRDRAEREVGGGIGMGNTCKTMADSCQCMQKPLQYCKVISLQLIKKQKKKKRRTAKAQSHLEIMIKLKWCIFGLMAKEKEWLSWG